jgi:S1-C subfamily serine protease
MNPQTFDPSGPAPSGAEPEVTGYAGPVPTAAPPQDAWNSPLWGRPDTVGGYWPEEPALDTAPATHLAPVPSRNGRRTALAVVALVTAALVGFGILKALPHDDNDVAAPSQSPSASAPATPGAAPSQSPSTGTQPGDQLPSDQQPGAQQPGGQQPGDSLPSLPAIPGLPGNDQNGSGSSQGTGTTSHPDAVAKVAPGIVNITTTVGYDGAEAAGTGEVLTSDGVVITNHHVIAGATSIKVAVAGTTTTYVADVVGYDSTHDIAVIKLRNASGMTIAPIGDSSTVKVGDEVIGLGNAGGKGGKPIPADGSVTGLDKSITAMDSENGTSEDLTGLIETDAAIQPGDSGGALVSTEGKVVGIITAGSTSGGRTTGATDGYAVPINQALKIAQDIRDGKASSTIHIGESAFLGIQVAGSGNSTNGVRIAGTVAGSAAAKAGLKAGDRITSLDGQAVTTNASLRALIAPHHPGDTVRIGWVDSTGKTRSADITFGSGPVA